ncbi:BlaI/MecI/CopY family transcriptional regulator [Actinocrinis sp.]|jgi:predicted transcriptional regulator|uniref:BlaI/MecI/CopY family transcriptional regulator n=1 Tax=Actinocrinis sp. TaxID=1920516 RepID=UPI002C8B1B85|nr:BlaI/MecI/CopY family transcriptional regulator [Actinocrinis sp.]HXR73561.1 BlaI/MecI/CopY family transcriptional regulator [Actinocrinis sp.]
MLPAAGSDGVPRRARGALEAAIMDVLWRAQGPLSPGEVRDLLGTCADAEARALSYSTVVTILTRLHGKKMLARTRVGRSFQYAPLADAAGLEARRLSALLDGSADRAAVLSRFVADLSDSDEELLRRLLGPTSSVDDARR